MDDILTINKLAPCFRKDDCQLLFASLTAMKGGLTDTNYRENARVGVKRVRLDGSDAVPGGNFKPLTYKQFVKVFKRMQAEADVALQAQMALRGWVEPDRAAAQRVLMHDGTILSIEEARKTGCLGAGGGPAGPEAGADSDAPAARGPPPSLSMPPVARAAEAQGAPPAVQARGAADVCDDSEAEREGMQAAVAVEAAVEGLVEAVMAAMTGGVEGEGGAAPDALDRSRPGRAAAHDNCVRGEMRETVAEQMEQAGQDVGGAEGQAATARERVYAHSEGAGLQGDGSSDSDGRDGQARACGGHRRADNATDVGEGEGRGMQHGERRREGAGRVAFSAGAGMSGATAHENGEFRGLREAVEW